MIRNLRKPAAEGRSTGPRLGGVMSRIGKAKASIGQSRYQGGGYCGDIGRFPENLMRPHSCGRRQSPVTRLSSIKF